MGKASLLAVSCAMKRRPTTPTHPQPSDGHIGATDAPAADGPIQGTKASLPTPSLRSATPPGGTGARGSRGPTPPRSLPETAQATQSSNAQSARPSYSQLLKLGRSRKVSSGGGTTPRGGTHAGADGKQATGNDGAPGLEPAIGASVLLVVKERSNELLMCHRCSC